ncbi:MAG: metal-dependent phosphohydrolase [Syntrophobacteraceae bacterium CG07_land_8_20_14_0_80_61_8]|nr:MAG: metal-dependent phosphohydrolase [Syntrophobacteraceae bacterium CG07_land_8_20_14_0_80_61_8]
MTVPGIQQCTDLMARVQLPPHIQEHSLRVAQVSIFLGRHLNRNSVRLDLELLVAAALLHDIAKGICIDSGCSHAALGAEMLNDWGYPQLAPIVAEHVFISPAAVAAPINESIVVNYADKRVRHTDIVDLDCRFADLIRRYAKNQQHEQALHAKLELYRQLEQRLFEHVAIVPADLGKATQEDLSVGA